MFTKTTKKKSAAAAAATGMCQVCSVIDVLMAAIVTLSTIAAITGAYKAHFMYGGMTFGTANASVALIALVLHLFLVKKLIAGCPCQIGAKK